MVGKEKYLLIFLGFLLVVSVSLLFFDIEMETAVDIARGVCVALALFFIALVIFVRLKLRRLDEENRTKE